MHIANITSASLDGQIEPIDLQQTPGDVIVLSFSNSDLSAIAQAHDAISLNNKFPSMRLAALKDLRHPMSVDLWLDNVAAKARVIVVRILGGYDWWPYGCDQLAALARQNDITLALLPGESHAHDERLQELSTCTPEKQQELLALFRAGGPLNMSALLRNLASLAGHGGTGDKAATSALAAIAPTEIEAADATPRMGFYSPDCGIVPIEHFVAPARTVSGAPTPAAPRPIVPILFYRALLLAGETAPIDALCKALHERGILAMPIFVPTLKEPDVERFLIETARTLPPAVIITTTAFAASLHAQGTSLFKALGAPVLQAIIATTGRAAWALSDRGLGTSDIAMNVVLPELDGRLLAGVVSLKEFTEPTAQCDSSRSGAADCGLASGPPGPLQFNALRNRPEPDCIELITARVAALLQLQQTPPNQRRIVLIMPDYPGADGRTGYAVGLDVPASILAMLSDLKEAGYHVRDIPQTPRDLVGALGLSKPGLDASDWQSAFQALPEPSRATVQAAWGEPSKTAPYKFRYAEFGNITVALAPDRGHKSDRRSGYHDADMPPGHDLLAFGHWLRAGLACHAVVHCGAHGTFEWLPGKAVALTTACFPQIMSGPLPVIYPFIVNNPGEAAQAKRRLCALTLGHMPPPMIDAGLTGPQRDLERLVDEYVQADGLDAERQKRLAQLILERAATTRLDRDAGIMPGADSNEALKKIDTWLCDLKDFAIKDGQHIYGRFEPDCTDLSRRQSARLERDNFLAALNGEFVSPGPAGSPSRGRTDVYPTGRNLFTIDPRMMPTPVAYELGQAAAEEVLRLFLQDHGDWPRSLVIDLWASASLRTGGEQIAQGLALLGCRPQWEDASGRIIGIEVLPPATIGRPRIDVTWRISGLFRDMFPAQIALINTAIEAIAKRGFEDGDNPLAAQYKASGVLPKRIFGSSPGSYGSGVEALLQSGAWEERAQLGAAYLAAGSHAFSGAEGIGEPAPGEFGDQIGKADLLLHNRDDTGHDLLEGSADVAYLGGFAAAVEALGGAADLICLDTTNPTKPRARSLADELRRTVRARAINPRYIRGQMHHGPRGASDFTETVDRLIGFAETTNAVPDDLIDALFDAYVGDQNVRDFMLRENPAAAKAVATRLLSALHRGLWHPRRNSTSDALHALLKSAATPPPKQTGRNDIREDAGQ